MNKRPLLSGFSLIEFIIYAGIFSALIVTIVTVAINFSRSYTEVSRYRALVSAGQTVLGRLVYEIHDANVLDVTKSLFNATSGVLVLVREDEAENATTSKFYLDSGLTVKLEQTLSNASAPPLGGGAGGGGHHDPCQVNNDCSESYPVCCAVPSHGPAKVCETNNHHGGICGEGIPSGTTTIFVLTAGSDSSTDDLYANKLTFRNLSATNSQAVRIELELTASSGPRQLKASFYDTAVLRGSYK